MRALTTGLGLALAVAGAGCASLPARGILPTGEALQIEERLFLAERIPADDGVRTRTSRASWIARQGSTELDREDFFRIAGDFEAAGEIRTRRANGVALNHVGLGVLGVGVAALAGGLIANPREAGLARGAVASGVALVPLGAALAELGARRAAARDGIPVLRARRAAARYNAAIEVERSPRGGSP